MHPPHDDEVIEISIIIKTGKFHKSAGIGNKAQILVIDIRVNDRTISLTTYD
jgi:hypothetical protein